MFILYWIYIQVYIYIYISIYIYIYGIIKIRFHNKYFYWLCIELSNFKFWVWPYTRILVCVTYIFKLGKFKCIRQFVLQRSILTRMHVLVNSGLHRILLCLFIELSVCYVSELCSELSVKIWGWPRSAVMKLKKYNEGNLVDNESDRWGVSTRTSLCTRID